MGTTYYRIHDTGRCSPEQLLESRYQVSRVWVGQVYRRCECCDGSGEEWERGELVGPCEHCQGEGQRLIERQDGVSVCRDLDDLRSYMSERSPYTEGCVLVELEGEELDELDVDHESGALLVRPTRIVRVGSVNEAL